MFLAVLSVWRMFAVWCELLPQLRRKIGRYEMKHGVDICGECEIKDNPRYFDCECEDCAI